MSSFIRKLQIGTALVALMMGASAYAMEGQEWNFNVRYDIAGITQTLPAYHRQQCLTEATPVPDISLPGQQCKTHVHGRFGNTLTWRVDCSSDWEIVQGVGRITFDGGRAGGDIHVQILSPSDVPQNMVFHIEGRTVNSCGISAAANARSVQR